MAVRIPLLAINAEDDPVSIAFLVLTDPALRNPGRSYAKTRYHTRKYKPTHTRSSVRLRWAAIWDGLSLVGVGGLSSR